MKRLYVAIWSALGWACLFGLKNWRLAAAAWAVGVLFEAFYGKN